MPNPAFIVDGFTELLILQKLCPGSPVKRTDLNGKTVAIPAIVTKISALIRTLGNRHHPIVILIDREKRTISSNQMIKQISDGLKAEGIADDIRIGVADIMLENWIIADWITLTGVKKGKPKKTDGINGAATIKKIKGQYSKTTDGVAFFLRSNPSIIYTESPSFKDFVDKILDINCEFLKNVIQ